MNGLNGGTAPAQVPALFGYAVALMRELRALTGEPYAAAVRRGQWRLVLVHDDVEEVRGWATIAEHVDDLQRRVEAAREKSRG